MKRSNKKGFTIVELVIVIAVIAILAAVLIPTFSTVVDKANVSKALQEARNKFTEAYAMDLSDGVLDGYDGETKISDANYGYKTVDSVKVAAYQLTDGAYYAEFDGSKWTAKKGTATASFLSAWAVKS